jgi:hypothetical protein
MADAIGGATGAGVAARWPKNVRALRQLLSEARSQAFLVDLSRSVATRVAGM